MSGARVKIEILSYWHAGTSHGDGAELDAIVAKTEGGLPFLPGRTVKGLLRAGLACAEEAKAVERGRVQLYFGTDLPRGIQKNRELTIEAGRFTNDEGKLRVESATLRDKGGSAAGWEAWARSDKKAGGRTVGHLFAALSSTKIENGVAADATLRTIEVAVPVVLVADVQVLDDKGLPAGWRDDLRKGCLFIHGLGVARNRGLGRARFSVEG